VLLGRRRGPGAFEQVVAIKTIRPEFAAAENLRAMFLDEARILGRLNHPGVATVHDFGEEGRTLYMVMEYVAGIPFRDFGDMRAPPMIVARAIAEACRGLHAAHELRDLHGNVLGLVHRDISPDNLMLGFDGHVKVIDFGIALVKNRQAPVTEFGMVKGKPPYMSPEQVKNDPMDRRSDVFSLGVVLWELLTHQLLFDGDSLYAIALAVANQDIPPPSVRVGGGLPIGLDAVVLNALDRNVASRTATAAQLAEELDAVITTSGEESLESWAARELAPRRDAHRAWLAGIVSGSPDLPKAVGRPSGSVTQLAAQPGEQPAVRPQPIALAATPIDARISGVDVAGMSTHVPAPVDDDEPLPPLPRRRLLPYLLAVLLLGAAGVAVMFVVGPSSNNDPTALRDAGNVVAQNGSDAGIGDARTIEPVAIDAAPVPVPVDAGEPDAPIDAGRHTIAHADAGVHVVPHADAAVTLVPVDAAEPAVVGNGTLRLLGPAGSYVQVSVDSAPAVPTPALRVPVHAGKHVVQFQDPKDGHVIYTETVNVADGQTVTVQPR
jgi:hypothetical protein